MEINKNPSKKYIIFYDGHCKICNWWTRFIQKRDKHSVFDLHPISSDQSKCFFKNHRTLNKDAIIVWDQKSTYWVASNAVFKILKHIGNTSKILLLFQVFPEKLNDVIYNFIARNRYKIFKRLDTCNYVLNDKISEDK